MLDHIADPSCYVKMGFVVSSALPQQLVINPLPSSGGLPTVLRVCVYKTQPLC